MALINPTTGEYLKIYEISIELKTNNHVYRYIIFLNSEQRQRFDTGLGKYETFYGGLHDKSVNIDTELNKIGQNNLSIKNNLITIGYNSIKLDENFSNWIDG